MSHVSATQAQSGLSDAPERDRDQLDRTEQAGGHGHRGVAATLLHHAVGSYDARCKEVVDVVHDLFTQLKSDGVEDVVYLFYPDPMGIGANIKAAMDILRPEMQKECEGSTDVRCIWVDQRESWESHYDMYTSEGIHPTEAGATASAQQIWDAMVAHCVAQQACLAGADEAVAREPDRLKP
jgi:hypothetical protein